MKAPTAQPTNRRSFLKRGALASATALVAPTIIPSSAFGANDRITVGYVGVGGRGFNNLDGLMKRDGTQVLAVCDVDKLHYGKNITRGGKAYGTEAAKIYVEDYYSKKGNTDYKGCDTYGDYRELCAREDIDVVAISTPDHWHALATIEALDNGKDVYCEKPITHLFAEGQAVYRKVAEKEAIFQTGSQQRSGKEFYQAVNLVQNGVLGKITDVKVGIPRGHDKAQGDPIVREPGPNLDYEMWTGPAPMLPYMPLARHHWNWRWHSAYGRGQLMDWIGHHQDINSWALDVQKSGPQTVEAVGWTFPSDEVYDTPVDYEVKCEYAGDIPVSIGSVNPMGTKWTGENGWIHVTRGKITASNEAWLADDFNPGSVKVYKSDNHYQNFIDGVRTRTECVAPAENAHRSITAGHLSFVAHELGKKIKWDPAKEEIIGDADAQKLLMELPYRAPWELKA